jgi:hypothetical protein
VSLGVMGPPAGGGVGCRREVGCFCLVLRLSAGFPNLNPRACGYNSAELVSSESIRVTVAVGRAGREP